MENREINGSVVGQLTESNIRSLQFHYQHTTDLLRRGEISRGAQWGGVDGTRAVMIGELTAQRDILLSIGQPDPLVDTESMNPAIEISEEMRTSWLKKYEQNELAIRKHGGFHAIADRVWDDGDAGQKQFDLMLMGICGENGTIQTLFWSMGMSGATPAAYQKVYDVAREGEERK